jgi:hypothetical protein
MTPGRAVHRTANANWKLTQRRVASLLWKPISMSKSVQRMPNSRRCRQRPTILAAFLVFIAWPHCLSAQHEHRAPSKGDSSRADSMGNMMNDPLGISHARMGSGTSWMPDSSPMHANHKMWGKWEAMVHGVAFAEYDDQGSTRGDRQLGIIDWEMLMAMRRVGSGMLHLHGMVSLEPATIGAKGYPLLLQTGESYKGQPLHDRQHPHDLFMELAAIFQQPVARNLAVEFYGGPAGEPALGPVAFMHRLSAQSDPFSALGHHWQDATHISYGVLTAGVYSRLWKLEGSVFNGREPDEDRWDFDFRRLDSYSGRLTVNPTGRWSLAGWYGYLASPEQLHPDEAVHRYGAAAMYGGTGIAGGAWASTLIWGANDNRGVVENSVLLEANVEIGSKNAVFGRAESVRKSAEELVLTGVAPDREFDIHSLVGGYVREVASIPGGSIGVGGRVSVNFIPNALEPFYGTRTPAGFAVYVRVRPKRMAMEPMAMRMPARDTMRMPGMSMPMDIHAPGQAPDPSERIHDSAPTICAVTGPRTSYMTIKRAYSSQILVRYLHRTNDSVAGRPARTGLPPRLDGDFPSVVRPVTPSPSRRPEAVSKCCSTLKLFGSITA